MSKIYAFIDVYNTLNTTEQLLGFTIDLDKLYQYLKKSWHCEQIFFYAGVDIGDVETAKEYQLLGKQEGCIVRTKTTIPYKRKDKKIDVKCPSCGKAHIVFVNMGYIRKSNCDVELTADALEYAQPGDEYLIFTGDGDFEYLIRKLIDKGLSVRIISNTSKNNEVGKRFSSKLRALMKEGKASFININSWRNRIQKDASK